jgi:multidrug transporter EmrE-like cation transporter
MAWIASILPPAALWGLGAAFPAVLAEYLYKTMPPWQDWWEMLWAWIPLQLTIGYCIFRLVTIPQSTLLDAFIVWALSTTAMRVFVSVVLLGETIKGGTWFALGLLIMAKLAQTFWGR